MADMTESQNSLVIEEADLSVFIRTYRALKESFRSRTRLVLLHIEDDIWEFRVIGLTSREWLEFCANVFAELPSETVDLVKEVQETSFSDPTGTNDSDEEDGGSYYADETSEEPEEEEYEDDGSEEEEEADEDTVNSEGETPTEEVERKLKKAKLVRKTGSAAVTVETD